MLSRDNYQKYTHEYLDGRIIEGVNQYPDIYYPMFTDWLKNVWIKEKCGKYICERMGMAAIPHLLKAFPNQIDAIPKKFLAENEAKRSIANQKQKTPLR